VARRHSTTSIIHRIALEVVDHLIDENGICEHTSVALGAMLGESEQTIYVVRTHLEACPDSKGFRLPYRAKGPMVLVDPEKTLTSLEDLKSARALPVMLAADSVIRTTNRVRARNVTAIDALEREAYNSGNTDLAQALGWAATDIRSSGDISPAVRYRLEQLGVLA
jgi:hypothetical protein